MSKSAYIVIILFIILGGGIISYFYKDIKIVENPDSLLVLVNKNNRLPDNFVPKNLEQISLEFATADKFLVKEAKEQFEKLSSTAKDLGYSIIAVSTYRSFQYQQQLFDNYTKELGLDHTLLYSAKPGHSEHQTGLTVDVMGSNNDYNLFETCKEFEWMRDNAYKFGFILRYPKDKVDITGFAYEPWHYRYVGKKVAKYIYENKLTLEEFLMEH